MNVVLRGLRVIDPLAGVDERRRDVWISDGRIAGISAEIDEPEAEVVDLTPPDGAAPHVLCPAFVDLHAHLREPGNEEAETIDSGARAAAAGGFGTVVAMANTQPVRDTAQRVGEARALARGAVVRVLPAAALTKGADGRALVDLAGCAAAGAVAFSDDGRNAVTPDLLTKALRAAAPLGRPILIHSEDERLVEKANPGFSSLSRCPSRPHAAETRAVVVALQALEAAGCGRIHLQHLSVGASVELVRRARQRGLAVTAEVTPHHLALSLPVEAEPDPHALIKVNPPLRGERDRLALVGAVRDGSIDAIATDHAPHRDADKAGDYEHALPGMIGLETALAACLTLGELGGAALPATVARLTAGPHRVLGRDSGLPEPRLEVGELATCTLFDPGAEWVVGEEPFQSRSRNTPLLGQRLRGKVLLTMVEGRVAHHDEARLPLALPLAGAVRV
ncbi:MAG TPA: dihydroorotase [Candidatus Sulfotelmatobacter sp.]|nr:dihydroorotase [Candidatus Sulfotelmatobacter sp.]